MVRSVAVRKLVVALAAWSAGTMLVLASAGGAARADDPIVGPPPVEHYPDLAVAEPDSMLKGRNTREIARARLYLLPGSRQRARVEVCNRNGGLGRITLQGTPGGARFGVRYETRAGENITGSVVAGTYRFRLAMGACRVFRVVVTRRAAAAPGAVRTFLVTAKPAMGSALNDRVGVVARAVDEPPHVCIPGGPGEPMVCS